MPHRIRQTVGVVLNLVGMQDIAAMAHHEKTDSAAVSVRIGKALIYMHDARTVHAFQRLWRGMATNAENLPQRFASDVMVPTVGMLEPGVLINAAGAPAATARLVRVAGAHTYLRVNYGRLLIQVRDREAFTSTAMGIRQAVTLAAGCFPAEDERLLADAFKVVSKALPAHRPAARRLGGSPVRTGRDWPPSRAGVPRPMLPKPSERWMQ